MSQRALRALLAVGVVLFGLWAGVRVYSSRIHKSDVALRTPAGEASAPNPTDFEVPTDAAGAIPVKIPDQLPDFSLADSAGRTTAVDVWKGKSLILNFWATWCAPCRREIPLLKALHGEWAERGVQVVGVAVDHRETVLAYAEEFHIAYPLLIGEQDALDVATRLGVTSPVFPFTVFTDRKGDVVTLYLGELRRPQADLILSVVQNLNLDKLGLADARQAIAEGLRKLSPDGRG